MKAVSVIVGVLLGALAVAGCVAPNAANQAQAQQVEQATREIQLINEVCWTRINTPETAILKGKLPLSAEEQATPPMAMLTNQDKASEAEKEALLKLDPLAVRFCSNLAIDWYRRWGTPQMVGIAEQVQATGRILRARLYEGSITYGEAARIRYEAVQQAQRALQEVAAAERQRAQTAAYQQQMANAASSAALINAGQTLLLLQQQNVLLQQSLGVNRFTQTQCRVFGNRIDCTTF